MPEKQSDGYVIKSLAKGLRALRAFDSDHVELALTEIATAADLPLPTAFRVIRTLEAEGFVEQTPEGAYRLGGALLRLGFAALDGMDLVRAAAPHLRALARQTNETVNLGVLDGVETRYLHRIRNADLVTAEIRVGSRLPAACTSMGKLLLAFLTVDEFDQKLPKLDFQAARGPRAIRTKKPFLAEIARIRKNGFAVQDEELEYGLRSVAAPVRDRSERVVAAVNIAVPATRWSREDLLERFLPALLETSHAISLGVGLQGTRVEG